MTGKEALQALLDGKKIRRSEWITCNYVNLKNNILLDERDEEIVSLDDVIETDDWEIYEEPKPKKLYAYWVDHSHEIRFFRSEITDLENTALERLPEYDIDLDKMEGR